MANHLLTNFWLHQNRCRPRLALVLVGLAVLAGALFLALPRPERGAPVEVVSGQPLLASNGSAFDSAPDGLSGAGEEGGAAPAAGTSGSAGTSGAVSTSGDASTSRAAGTSRAALSANFHNFGTIGPTALVRQDFLLSNRGSAPLRIARAYTTCGCTRGEVSARVIPPGKAARVTVIFDAGYHPTGGQTVRRGLILETNDPDHPQVEIWVQATVRGK